MPVNDTSPEYDNFYPIWQKCRLVMAGEEAVHGAAWQDVTPQGGRYHGVSRGFAGEYFLPPLEGQSYAEYWAYQMRAGFFGASSRTRDILSGMIFRKAPAMELTDGLEALKTDVSLEGTDLQGFAEEIVDEILTVGRAGILVDHQPPGLESRPYLTLYKAEAVISTRTEVIDGIKTLTMVRLAEVRAMPDPEDEFNTKHVDQIRVLDLVGEGTERFYRQRVFQKPDDEWVQQGEDVFPVINGQRMTFIPFVFIGPKDTTARTEKPPLLDLVNTNLQHYRTSADLNYAAHWSALPTPVVTGMSKDALPKMPIGSSEAWVLPDPDAKAFFLEFTGQGLDALFKLIEQIKAEMAQLGARFLAPEKRAAEAAETEVIRRSGENSSLASMAQAISAGIQQALRWMALWLNEDPERVRFELNTDYLAVPLSPQALTAIMAAWQGGLLSEPEAFDILKRGEAIPEEKTLEEHQAEIDISGPMLNPDAEDLEDAA